MTEAFVATQIESIPALAKSLRTSYAAQKTKPLEWRLTQLRKLYWSITDNEEALLSALKSDLNKSVYESYLSEIDWCKNDILFVCKNLEKWMKDEKPSDIPFTQSLVAPKIRKDPLGAVLVIGAYNFPVQLSVGPMIGAISAGCTVLLKPSEQAPATAMVLQRIVKALDSSCYTVAQGGVPETTEILNQKWDKIFYTGGATVAKIIAKKAAETLTPLTLELGGKNPAFVTRNADLRIAARRLMWAKFHNAGQVCISQNYILVDKEVLPGLLQEIHVVLKEYMPNGAAESPDYSRIATDRQWSRLKGLLDSTSGKILIGGKMDQATRFLEPTVVKVEDPNDPLIQEETFGPITSLVPVDDLDQAIRIANEVDETPLGAYPFGTKAETDKVLAELRSGGASVNDGFFHGAIPTLAFGGVGNSGQGAYRGKASFDCFTHRRSIVKTPTWMEGLLNVRYPPYAGKLQQFQKMNNGKPNFGRDGKVRIGLLRWLLTLGAGSASGGVARYAIILIVAAGAKQFMDRRASKL